VVGFCESSVGIPWLAEQLLVCQEGVWRHVAVKRYHFCFIFGRCQVAISVRRPDITVEVFRDSQPLQTVGGIAAYLELGHDHSFPRPFLFTLALQPQFGPWPTFMKLSVSLRFSRSWTFDRTPWAGDQHVARPLPAHKHRKTSTSLPVHYLLSPRHSTIYNLSYWRRC
jgi:hypothetical protein